MVLGRIKFVCGDLLEPLISLPGLKAGLSVIVANPPYIPTRQLIALPREVRSFEPHLALDGGNDGLSFYRRLLRDALVYLQPGGNLVMEMGEGQALSICEEAERLAAWHIQNIRQDDSATAMSGSAWMSNLEIPKAISSNHRASLVALDTPAFDNRDTPSR